MHGWWKRLWSQFGSQQKLIKLQLFSGFFVPKVLCKCIIWKVAFVLIPAVFLLDVVHRYSAASGIEAQLFERGDLWAETWIFFRANWLHFGRINFLSAGGEQTRRLFEILSLRLHVTTSPMVRQAGMRTVTQLSANFPLPVQQGHTGAHRGYTSLCQTSLQRSRFPSSAWMNIRFSMELFDCCCIGCVLRCTIEKALAP